MSNRFYMVREHDYSDKNFNVILWAHRSEDYLVQIVGWKTGSWRVSLYAGKEMRILENTHVDSRHGASLKAIEMMERIRRGFEELKHYETT